MKIGKHEQAQSGKGQFRKGKSVEGQFWKGKSLKKKNSEQEQFEKGQF